MRSRQCQPAPAPLPRRKVRAEMGRIILGAALVCAVAGCAVGPSYRRPELGVPAEWRHTDPTADSLRPFYDSLMANRDTLPLSPIRPEAVSADTSPRDGVFLTDT